MGNTPSSVGVGDFEVLPQNFEFIKKFNDTRFGDVKFLRERATGTKILQKDYITNSAKDFEATLNEIKKRSSVNHPNLIRVIGYTSKQENAFCANYYKISVYYESYEYDLENDIIGRQQKEDHFPEAEIWDILDCVVTACAHLQANEEVHGDLRPFNVFACGDKEYKVADTRLFNGDSLPARYGLEGRWENKGRHYSPLIFEYMGKSNKKNALQHDKYKSDVFSLGLTVLEAITLQNLEFVYNWKEHKVEIDKIRGILEEQTEQKVYSPALIETIRFMVDPDEAQRPDFLRLDADLSLYRAEIRNRAIKNEFAQSPITPILTEQNEDGEEKKEGEDDDDLDTRIRAAIEKSEFTMKNCPVKHIARNVDAYYGHLVNHKDGLVSQKVDTDDRGATTKTFEETIESTNRGVRSSGALVRAAPNDQGNQLGTGGIKYAAPENKTGDNRNVAERKQSTPLKNSSVMKYGVLQADRKESDVVSYISVYDASVIAGQNNAIKAYPQYGVQEKSIPVAGESGLDQAGNLNIGAASRHMHQSGDRHPVVQEFQPSAIESKTNDYGAPNSTNYRAGSNTGTTQLYSKPIDGRSATPTKPVTYSEASGKPAYTNIRAFPTSITPNYQAESDSGAYANVNVSTNYPGTSQYGASTGTVTYGQTNVQPRAQNPESIYKTYTPISTTINRNANPINNSTPCSPGYQYKSGGNSAETSQINATPNSTHAPYNYGSTKYTPVSYSNGKPAQK